MMINITVFDSELVEWVAIGNALTDDRRDQIESVLKDKMIPYRSEIDKQLTIFYVPTLLYITARQYTDRIK